MSDTLKVSRRGPAVPLTSTASSDGEVTGDDIDWPTSPIGMTMPALDDLTDVNAPTPADQDVLTWDDSVGEWIAQAGGGGGSPNLDGGIASSTYGGIAALNAGGA